MSVLANLPFNHIQCDDEFQNIISQFWYDDIHSRINFDLYNNITFNIVDSDQNVNNPSYNHDPDSQLSIYRNTLNDVLENCQYNDVEYFASNANVYRDYDFSLFHFNVRSLSAHEVELHALLHTLNHKFTVYGLCETWLKESDYSLYCLDGYTPIHKYRTDRRGGGVSLFVKAEINFELRDDLAEIIGNTAESVFIEIPKSNCKFNKKIIIAEIYRPPNYPIDTFIEALDILLDTIQSDGAICYFMGDFNINLLQMQTLNNEFLNIFLSHGWAPVISKPTRVTTHSFTLIDHVYTNDVNNVNNATSCSGVILNSITDHFPVFFMCKTTKLKYHTICKYKQMINSRTLAKMKEEICKVDWHSMFNNDVQHDFDAFDEVFYKLYAQCFPLKKIVLRTNHKPWINSEILNSIKRKNKLYKEYLKNPCLVTEKRYKLYRNRVHNDLRNAERKYIKSNLQNNATNMRASWQMINTVLNRKQKNYIYPTMMTDGSVTTCDQKQTANLFANYFANVGPNLASEIPMPDGLTHMSYMGTPNEATMKFDCITTDEVLQIIKNLKNSSHGHDQVKSQVVKYIAPQLTFPLTHLINLSLKAGIFPDKLKKAVITPIYKNGEKKSVKNYRPISVLSVFSKIYERVAYKQLITFLNSYNILSPQQFGFRNGFSSDYALISTMDHIISELNNRNSIIALGLDIRKAFDTINHKILIEKMDHYGIRNVTLSWFRSYLEHRTHQVKIDTYFSKEELITCGVPQGSILGPLLFILYLNDFVNVNPNNHNVLYADDTNIFFTTDPNAQNVDRINIQLDYLNKWFAVNHLSLSHEKTNYMFFSNNRPPENIMLKIGNCILSQVRAAKFLGVMIDDKLTWIDHIEYIKKKVSKCISIIFKVRYLLSTRWKLKLYKTFVLPLFNYCNIVWGSAPISHLRSLLVSQKKVLKMSLNLHRYSPTDFVYESSGCHSINNINKIHCCIFMYKYVHNILPNTFQNRYMYFSDSHSYFTRQERNIRLPFPRINIFKKSILYRGPLLWNELTLDIKNSTSLDNFKYNIKKYIPFL